MELEKLYHTTVEEKLGLKPDVEGLHKQLDIHDVWWDDEGRTYMQLRVTEQTLNPFGSIHGGSIFTLCDMVAEACIVSKGRMGVTLDGNIHFFRPAALGSVLAAVAEERKDGRSTAVCQVTVRDEEERSIAEATFTLFYTDHQ